MSDLPVNLAPALARRLEAAMDRAGKIGLGLEALGPVAGRDVVMVDSTGGPIRSSLVTLGARVVDAPLSEPLRLPQDDASADAVIGLWSAFRGPDPGELAEVDRVLRPEGRHLVVHHYGRDDVSHLLGSRPEYGSWSRRGGPFLTGGFRVRVVHCWWDFESAAETAAFLGEAFGPAGVEVAATLKRPRLSWNVAIYHRSRAAGREG